MSPGVFHRSHRITSASSHLGSDPSLGSPTVGARAAVAVIADCVCKDNRIIDECLVRD